MPNTHAADERPQIETGEDHRDFRCKGIPTVFMIVATALSVPECMEQAVVMRLASVRAEPRVRVWRNAHLLVACRGCAYWRPLCFLGHYRLAGRGGWFFRLLSEFPSPVESRRTVTSTSRVTSRVTVTVPGWHEVITGQQEDHEQRSDFCPSYLNMYHFHKLAFPRHLAGREASWPVHVFDANWLESRNGLLLN